AYARQSPPVHDLSLPPPPSATPVPYTTLYRSTSGRPWGSASAGRRGARAEATARRASRGPRRAAAGCAGLAVLRAACGDHPGKRSEEHTSELQSRENLVCRLLLEKKKAEPQGP